MKRILSNFKENILFPVSAGAFLSLCLTRDIRWDLFLSLVFLGLTVLSFFGSFRFSLKVFSEKAAFIGAFILSTAAFINFYFQMNEELGIPRKTVASFGLNPELTFALTGFSVFLVSLFFTNVFMSRLLKALTPLFRIIAAHKKPLCVLIAVYAVSLIAVFRSNFYYVDDIGRTFYGYGLTGNFARYAATFIANFLHSNTWLSDISPLTQIVAVVLIALAGLVLMCVFSDGKEIKLRHLPALIPLGLSPYFISCLSYKFDAPYMAASVLFSVLPLLYKDKRTVHYILAVFSGTLLMCTTYQASSGIFPMAVWMLAFFMWMKKQTLKAILRFILTSAAGYIPALILFKLLLVQPVEAEDYVNNTISVQSVFLNIKTYAVTVFTDLGMFWSIFLTCVVISFIAVCLKRSQHKKRITLPVTVLVIAIGFILSFGVYIILESPLFMPRALYGSGVLISLLSIPVVLSEKKYFGKSAVIVLSWFFIVFAFIYGNALTVQQEYADFRTEQIISDMKEADLLRSDTEIALQISGTIGHAEAIENMIKKYPVLERSVPVMLRGYFNYWGHFKLIHYYGLDHIQMNSEESGIDFNDLDLPVVTDNIYHTIKADHQHILIMLK